MPVLTVFGEKDILFGNTGTKQRLQSEPTFYPNAPVVNVYAIPETGHVLALSETAPRTNEIIFEWLHQNGLCRKNELRTGNPF